MASTATCHRGPRQGRARIPENGERPGHAEGRAVHPVPRAVAAGGEAGPGAAPAAGQDRRVPEALSRGGAVVSQRARWR
ncbi:hypothetical protein G6F62_014262 [Rhizopus arrhizus]|nr:hypothetical protein G6F62_014262 [Rhizopus arrhizus]